MDHRQLIREMIAEFFAPSSFSLRSHQNRQVFDFAGLRGRLLPGA